MGIYAQIEPCAVVLERNALDSRDIVSQRYSYFISILYIINV